MTTKIYVLTEPDGKIRYIGKTMCSLSKRLVAHLGDAKRGVINHRCNWIRSVFSRGYLPAIQLISEVEGDGCKEEIAWISYGRQEEWMLTNETAGGEGMTGRSVSAASRLKISETLKNNPVRYWLGKKRSKSTCIKIGLARLGCKATEKTREKMRFTQHKRRQAERELAV